MRTAIIVAVMAVLILGACARSTPTTTQTVDTAPSVNTGGDASANVLDASFEYNDTGTSSEADSISDQDLAQATD